MEKQMKEAEASTFFHEHHPDHVSEEGYVFGDPGVAWAKEETPGNRRIIYIAVKVAKDGGWMT